MGKFLSAQGTAATLIAKFGTKVQVRRKTVTGFDPVAHVESATVVDTTFTAVLLPPSQASRFKVNLEGKNATEVYFSLQDQEMQPEPGDTLIAGGKEWAIFWAQTFDPALDGAIFTLAYAER